MHPMTNEQKWMDFNCDMLSVEGDVRFKFFDKDVRVRRLRRDRKGVEKKAKITFLLLLQNHLLMLSVVVIALNH